MLEDSNFYFSKDVDLRHYMVLKCTNMENLNFTFLEVFKKKIPKTF